MKLIKGQVWIPLGNLLYIFDYLCIYINSMCYPYTYVIIIHISYCAKQVFWLIWSTPARLLKPLQAVLKVQLLDHSPRTRLYSSSWASRARHGLRAGCESEDETLRSLFHQIHRIGWVGCLAILTRMDRVSGEIREYVFGTQSAHDTTSYNAYHSLIKSGWNIYGQ